MGDSFQLDGTHSNSVDEARPWNTMPVDTSLRGMDVFPQPIESAKNGTVKTALDTVVAPLRTLKGLGPRAEELLTKLLAKPLEPPRVIDLLFHLPTGYVDRRPAAGASVGGFRAVSTLLATPVQYAIPPRGARRAPVKVVCETDSGSLDLIFFHGDANAIKALLPLNEARLVSGRVERREQRLQMTHPDYILSPERCGEIPPIEPVYPLTLGLTHKALLRFMAEALGRVGHIAEWNELAFLGVSGWPSFYGALRILHAPRSDDDIALWGMARARLGFDEIYSAQLAIALVRLRHRAIPGRTLVGTGEKTASLRAGLPYTLTRSQEQALAEIKADMSSGTRMLRLLQGDVGSGKTVVAALAMASAVEAGTQAVLMAPTDVLARQHLETLGPLCGAAGIAVGYLSGRDQGKTRASALDRLRSGDTQIVIGTHALFQPDVVFHDLGLAVIDEQHRFGVAQRLALQEKARNGDAGILVMTATPIPRTLLLSLHGDLEVSQLREKPAGRKPVATRAVPIDRLEDIVHGLRRACREGAQVYWVCPAVESGAARDMAAAEARAAHLKQVFGESVGLVHGRMSGPQKDAAVLSFVNRETSILVATTVIEVGVNVPNATVMIVENAEMFGLAQLHQLRGRVGRGSAASSCVLLYKSPLSETAKARIDTMRQIDDGFEIAEEDLKLRGGGDMLGARQSGDAGFRLASWPAASGMIETAARQAQLLLERDPVLMTPAGDAARICLRLFERSDAVRVLHAG